MGAIDKNAAAAWTQAIGSVIAVFVAVLVPLLIRRDDRAREARASFLKAKGFALELLPRVEYLRSTLRAARASLRDEEAYLTLDEIAERIQIPPSLEGSVRYLHELGPVAGRIQNAIAAALRARHLIEDEYDYIRNGGVLYLPDGDEISLPKPADFEPDLSFAIEQVELAARELQEMFPNKGDANKGDVD